MKVLKDNFLEKEIMLSQIIDFLNKYAKKLL
jgi:hypothetical protein